MRYGRDKVKDNSGSGAMVRQERIDLGSERIVDVEGGRRG